MTGFRVALGGAQERFGIVPDLTTLGKIIGGGLPLAAYGGRADIMQKIAPLGPVYQAGTLSGNPMAVAAGLAMLRHLVAHPEIYDTLEARSAQLTQWTPPGVTINRVGAMFTFFCSADPVTDWESAKKCDTERFGKLFHFLLERGIYMARLQLVRGGIHFQRRIRKERILSIRRGRCGIFFESYGRRKIPPRLRARAGRYLLIDWRSGY